jgi:hypothetical protein
MLRRLMISVIRMEVNIIRGGGWVYMVVRSVNVRVVSVVRRIWCVLRLRRGKTFTLNLRIT